MATVCPGKRFSLRLSKGIGRPQISHQVARGKNTANIVGGYRTAIRPQDTRASGKRPRGQGNVIRDDDIFASGMIGYPFVSRVRPVIDNRKVDQGVLVWPDSTITHHLDLAFMPDSDRGDLLPHRAGIGINIDDGHKFPSIFLRRTRPGVTGPA